jgi:hypothetical protein
VKLLILLGGVTQISGASDWQCWHPFPPNSSLVGLIFILAVLHQGGRGHAGGLHIGSQVLSFLVGRGQSSWVWPVWGVRAS